MVYIPEVSNGEEDDMGSNTTSTAPSPHEYWGDSTIGRLPGEGGDEESETVEEPKVQIIEDSGDIKSLDEVKEDEDWVEIKTSSSREDVPTESPSEIGILFDAATLSLCRISWITQSSAFPGAFDFETEPETPDILAARTVCKVEEGV